MKSVSTLPAVVLGAVLCAMASAEREKTVDKLRELRRTSVPPGKSPGL
jgi:hypothetical protein